MESDLTQTRARLEEALERVKSVHQAVMIDLPCIIEVSFLHLSLAPWSFTSCLSTPALQGLEEMSSCKSYFLWEEHARMEREATVSW